MQLTWQQVVELADYLDGNAKLMQRGWGEQELADISEQLHDLAVSIKELEGEA